MNELTQYLLNTLLITMIVFALCSVMVMFILPPAKWLAFKISWWRYHFRRWFVPRWRLIDQRISNGVTCVQCEGEGRDGCLTEYGHATTLGSAICPCCKGRGFVLSGEPNQRITIHEENGIITRYGKLTATPGVPRGIANDVH